MKILKHSLNASLQHPKAIGVIFLTWQTKRAESCFISICESMCFVWFFTSLSSGE